LQSITAGARYLSYDAIVEEALCFGWLNSFVWHPGIRHPGIMVSALSAL